MVAMVMLTISHCTSSGGVQARKCMELAIKDAGIDPKDVNYINAHGYIYWP